VWLNNNECGLNMSRREDKFAKRLGRLLATKRLAKQLTQEQLAERLGVEQETISRFERGATLPPLARLLEIADVLDVALDELVRSTSHRLPDQAADITVMLESLDEENREWIRTWVSEMCRKLTAKRKSK
jgi:transcriptional regulator with XRE-family HTH domain